jgi:hypothetical protein
MLSTTGLTVNLHYCQHRLYDIALNAPAKDCCKDGTHAHHCHGGSDMEDSNHCDDQTVKVESLDILFVSSYSFDFDDVKQIDVYQGTDQFLKIQGTAVMMAHKVLNYKKPPPSGVVLSRIQSFLI